MKNSFFYSNTEIKQLKELIRTGEPLRQIALREHGNFNAALSGFYQKLQKLSKSTYNIQKWEGPKRIRTKSFATKTVVSKPTETHMPEGFTFEGTPKKVTFCLDHFRVYF